MSDRHGFWYDLDEDRLRIGLRRQLVLSIPYERIERVERGWAPGLQVGGPGMPDRGDEVRVRAALPGGLPWASLTPLEPDGFVSLLRARCGPMKSEPASEGGPSGHARGGLAARLALGELP